MPKYTLSYDKNAGNDTVTGIVTSTQHDFGASTAVANEPSRDGHSFTGWAINVDGSGTNYDAGDSITMNLDVTLYAQWKQNITPGGDTKPGGDTTPTTPGRDTIPDGPVTDVKKEESQLMWGIVIVLILSFTLLMVVTI